MPADFIVKEKRSLLLQPFSERKQPDEATGRQALE